MARADDSVAPAAGATAVSYDTDASDVSVFGLTFRRPNVGLPAFIDWLCAERRTDTVVLQSIKALPDALADEDCL